MRKALEDLIEQALELYVEDQKDFLNPARLENLIDELITDFLKEHKLNEK